MFELRVGSPGRRACLQLSTSQAGRAAGCSVRPARGEATSAVHERLIGAARACVDLYIHTPRRSIARASISMVHIFRENIVVTRRRIKQECAGRSPLMIPASRIPRTNPRVALRHRASPRWTLVLSRVLASCALCACTGMRVVWSSGSSCSAGAPLSRPTPSRSPPARAPAVAAPSYARGPSPRRAPPAQAWTAPPRMPPRTRIVTRRMPPPR